MKSPEVVRQAFALREAGTIRREIAAELGISMSTLGRWLHGGLEATISPHRLGRTDGLCPDECPRRVASLLSACRRNIGRACSRSTVRA